jgi:hypothetical protein
MLFEEDHTRDLVYLASQFKTKHSVTIIFAQVEGYENFFSIYQANL